MSLSEVVRTSRVVVSVGSGGVGKTTCAAILAMQAAREGRRALVMTVDPARRLANALGEEGLDHDVRRIDLDVGSGGELWATMLDMKRTFDAIVDRYAPDEETRDRILENRFYHHFSTSLAGSQELSASERLYEVVESGRWDLVVLDTPPTTNALDFLDAPVRFFDALDSAALQWVLAATGFARKGPGALVGAGTQFLLRTLGRFTGQGFFYELGEFLFHFSELFEGIRQRSEATQRIFQDELTRFVIVTSPDPATIDEALYFRGQLDEAGIRLGGVVVNRIRRPFVDNQLAHGSINEVADAIETIEGTAILGRPMLTRLARKLLENAHELDRLAVRDRRTVDELAELVGSDIPITTVPMYATDVHTVKGLGRMRNDLFPESTALPAEPPSAADRESV